MVWGIQWSSFSQLEMTVILLMLLNCWKKSKSVEAMYWRIALTVLGQSGNTSQSHGASYMIPPQSNVFEPWPVDWHLYKERHLVDFSRLKYAAMNLKKTGSLEREASSVPSVFLFSSSRFMPKFLPFPSEYKGSLTD